MICVNLNSARVGLLAAAATLLAVAPSHALTARHDGAQTPGTVSTGTCTSGASAYSVSTNLQTTTSRNYKDVTGTSVAFTQGASGCVEVSFSSEAATTPGELLETRAVVDGTACLPSNNLFASDSPSSDLADHAMNYICTGVSAGSHTAKIQFRSRFGGKVALDYRTTIVRYAP
jgi:hypothetical protein